MSFAPVLAVASPSAGAMTSLLVRRPSLALSVLCPCDHPVCACHAATLTYRVLVGIVSEFAQLISTTNCCSLDAKLADFVFPDVYLFVSARRGNRAAVFGSVFPNGTFVAESHGYHRDPTVRYNRDDAYSPSGFCATDNSLIKYFHHCREQILQIIKSLF